MYQIQNLVTGMLYLHEVYVYCVGFESRWTTDSARAKTFKTKTAARLVAGQIDWNTAIIEVKSEEVAS